MKSIVVVRKLIVYIIVLYTEKYPVMDKTNVSLVVIM